MTDKRLPASKYHCSVLAKFISEDNQIWHFDDSWNVNIGGFQLQNHGGEKLKISFTFEAALTSISPDGRRTTIIADEDLDEFQPHRDEKLEVLLDLLSLHAGTPLAIIDGSFVIQGGGYGSSCSPVTNTLSLFDTSGLEKRYQNLLSNKNDLTNALRFFRLSLMDKDWNGKAIKLWATLEALYKGYELAEDPICRKLSRQEKKQIRNVINNQEKLSDREKQRLINTIFMQKLSSKSTLLSQRLHLMNEGGSYEEDEIAELVAWWSDARNAPSHGERIRPDDEERQNAVDDFEDTVEMLLQSGVTPAMHAYFIGHPDDVERGFWDKNDETITKETDDCWIKPTEWGRYLLENMGHHKVGSNMPLLYVSHDKAYELSREGITELVDISSLPEQYQVAIKKVQKKLNENVQK